MPHISAKRKAYIEKNRSRILEVARIWGQKNAEKMKAYRQEYYQEHKSYFREHAKAYYGKYKSERQEYYLKNRDTIIERVRKYNQLHKEEFKEKRKLKKLLTGRW